MLLKYVFDSRHDDEKYCLMSCKLLLDPDIIEFRIPYKYVIFTKKSEAIEDGCYEFIKVPTKYGILNRVLMLTTAEQQEAREKGIGSGLLLI